LVANPRGVKFRMRSTRFGATSVPTAPTPWQPWQLAWKMRQPLKVPRSTLPCSIRYSPGRGSAAVFCARAGEWPSAAKATTTTATIALLGSDLAVRDMEQPSATARLGTGPMMAAQPARLVERGQAAALPGRCRDLRVGHTSAAGAQEASISRQTRTPDEETLP
jgi:hypothetical protein